MINFFFFINPLKTRGRLGNETGNRRVEFRLTVFRAAETTGTRAQTNRTSPVKRTREKASAAQRIISPTPKRTGSFPLQFFINANFTFGPRNLSHLFSAYKNVFTLERWSKFSDSRARRTRRSGNRNTYISRPETFGEKSFIRSAYDIRNYLFGVSV